MEEGESIDIVRGYALKEGHFLTECPISNSWSFLLSMPNMAAGVRYQDDVMVIIEEEEGGEVSIVCVFLYCYCYHLSAMYMISPINFRIW